MKCGTVGIVGLVAAILVGCEKTNSDRALYNQAATVVVKTDPEALANQVRDAMTAPEIMNLEYEGRRAQYGVRGMRQREVARPLMLRLISCGKAAETPLGLLIDDEDESVRRSCVMLMNIRTPWMDDQGKPIDSQAIIELAIPILERALESEDSEVRVHALAALGDYKDFSAECLERLRLTLPKLRELKNDDSAEVRGMAATACHGVLFDLANRGQSPEIRTSASDELRQLMGEEK